LIGTNPISIIVLCHYSLPKYLPCKEFNISHVNLSKENNNIANECGEVKYFKYVKKCLGLPG
jgi:hypothetical protein